MHTSTNTHSTDSHTLPNSHLHTHTLFKTQVQPHKGKSDQQHGQTSSSSSSKQQQQHQQQHSHNTKPGGKGSKPASIFVAPHVAGRGGGSGGGGGGQQRSIHSFLAKPSLPGKQQQPLQPAHQCLSTPLHQHSPTQQCLPTQPLLSQQIRAQNTQRDDVAGEVVALDVIGGRRGGAQQQKLQQQQDEQVLGEQQQQQQNELVFGGQQRQQLQQNEQALGEQQQNRKVQEGQQPQDETLQGEHVQEQQQGEKDIRRVELEQQQQQQQQQQQDGEGGVVLHRHRRRSGARKHVLCDSSEEEGGGEREEGKGQEEAECVGLIRKGGGEHEEGEGQEEAACAGLRGGSSTAGVGPPVGRFADGTNARMNRTATDGAGNSVSEGGVLSAGGLVAVEVDSEADSIEDCGRQVSAEVVAATSKSAQLRSILHRPSHTHTLPSAPTLRSLQAGLQHENHHTRTPPLSRTHTPLCSHTHATFPHAHTAAHATPRDSQHRLQGLNNEALCPSPLHLRQQQQEQQQQHQEQQQQPHQPPRILSSTLQLTSSRASLAAAPPSSQTPYKGK